MSDKIEIQIVTPQFLREPNYPQPAGPPETREDWDNLCNQDPATLRELGLRPWDIFRDSALWLFPGEWYKHIPNGFEVMTIGEELEPFVLNVTDDDIRFGMLPYGIIAAAPKGAKAA